MISFPLPSESAKPRQKFKIVLNSSLISAVVAS
jgi:hypothetical protein